MIEWEHYPKHPLHIEVLQHWLHTRNNLTHFYEQSGYIDTINQYTTGQSSQPLIVWGVSGCGKSALLSKIASVVSVINRINVGVKFAVRLRIR